MLHRRICARLQPEVGGRLHCAWKLGGWSELTWHEADADADAAMVSVGGGRLKGVPRDEDRALDVLVGLGMSLIP